MTTYTNLGPITTPFNGTAYACNLCGSLIIEQTTEDARHTAATNQTNQTISAHTKDTHTLYHDIQSIDLHTPQQPQYNATYLDFELETDGSWSNSQTDYPATPTENNLLNMITTLETTLETISELINLYNTYPNYPSTITHILTQIENIKDDND